MGEQVSRSAVSKADESSRKKINEDGNHSDINDSVSMTSDNNDLNKNQMPGGLGNKTSSQSVLIEN